MHILKGLYWASLLLTLAAVAMLALDEWMFANLIFGSFTSVDRFGSSLISYVMHFNLDIQFENNLQLSLPKKDMDTGFLGRATTSSGLLFREYISEYHLSDAADLNELTIGPTIRLALYPNLNTGIDSIRNDWASTLDKIVFVINRAELQFPLSDSYECSRKLFSGDFKRRTTKLYRTYFPLAASPAICSYLSVEPSTSPTISDVLEQMRLLEEPMRFDLLRVADWFLYIENNGQTYSSFASRLPSPLSVQSIWDQLKNCKVLRKANASGCSRDIPFEGSLILDTSRHLLEAFWNSRKAPEDFEKFGERYMHATFNGDDPLVQAHLFLALSKEPIVVAIPGIQSRKYRQEIKDFMQRGSFLLDGTAPLVMEDNQRWWDFYWANLIKALEHYRIAIGRQGVSVWTALMLMILATSAQMTWRRVKATVSTEAV